MKTTHKQLKTGKGNVITIIITVLFIAAVIVGTLTRDSQVAHNSNLSNISIQETELDEDFTETDTVGESDEIEFLEEDLEIIEDDLDEINLDEFDF